MASVLAMNEANPILQFSQRPIQKETILLTLICMVDLTLTLVVIGLGKAVESNPILQPYVSQGMGSFIAAKTFLSMAPLVGLEMVSWVNPKLAKLALRIGIAGYLGVYLFGSQGIHGLI